MVVKNCQEQITPLGHMGGHQPHAQGWNIYFLLGWLSEFKF